MTIKEIFETLQKNYNAWQMSDEWIPGNWYDGYESALADIETLLNGKELTWPKDYEENKK